MAHRLGNPGKDDQRCREVFAGGYQPISEHFPLFRTA